MWGVGRRSAASNLTVNWFLICLPDEKSTQVGDFLPYILFCRHFALLIISFLFLLDYINLETGKIQTSIGSPTFLSSKHMSTQIISEDQSSAQIICTKNGSYHHLSQLPQLFYVFNFPRKKFKGDRSVYKKKWCITLSFLPFRRSTTCLW